MLYHQRYPRRGRLDQGCSYRHLRESSLLSTGACASLRGPSERRSVDLYREAVARPKVRYWPKADIENGPVLPSPQPALRGNASFSSPAFTWRRAHRAVTRQNQPEWPAHADTDVAFHGWRDRTPSCHRRCGSHNHDDSPTHGTPRGRWTPTLQMSARPCPAAVVS